MPQNVYFITQFVKPKKHRAGQVNKDKRIFSGRYRSRPEALKALCDYMDKHRINDMSLRLDRNVRPNPIAYADLDENGGVVRFKLPDGFHFSSQITLDEFKRRLLGRR